MNNRGLINCIITLMIVHFCIIASYIQAFAQDTPDLYDNDIVVKVVRERVLMLSSWNEIAKSISDDDIRALVDSLLIDEASVWNARSFISLEVLNQLLAVDPEIDNIMRVNDNLNEEIDQYKYIVSNPKSFPRLNNSSELAELIGIRNQLNDDSIDRKDTECNVIGLLAYKQIFCNQDDMMLALCIIDPDLAKNVASGLLGCESTDNLKGPHTTYLGILIGLAELNDSDISCYSNTEYVKSFSYRMLTQ